MGYTLPSMVGLLQKYDHDTLFNPDFFEKRTSKVMGHEYIGVKPIARFKDDVELGFNVGCRSNGMDEPKWPSDLSVEVVT